MNTVTIKMITMNTSHYLSPYTTYSQTTRFTINHLADNNSKLDDIKGRLCSVALPPISFCSHCQLLLPQSSILSLNFEMLPLWLVGLGCSEPSQCFQEESTAPSSKNCWLSASYFDPYMTGNFVSCQSSLDPPWALAQAS